MKKLEYIKPELRIHHLMIENRFLGGFSNDNTETDEQGAKCFEGVIDDLEEGTTIQQEHTATEYYTK